MNSGTEGVAKTFLAEYNEKTGSRYRLDELKPSALQSPATEYYRMQFIEEKKRGLLGLGLSKNKLQVEVAKIRFSSESDISVLGKVIESEVDSMELDAYKQRLDCAKHLLIDISTFGSVEISDPDNLYRKQRLWRDKMISGNAGELQRLGLKRDKKEEARRKEQLQMVGFSTEHWFKEIWLIHANARNEVRCVQLW